MKVSNNKSDFQGHSRALAMTPFNRPHIRFPTSLPLRLCFYLAQLTRYLPFISQHLKRPRDTEHILLGATVHACTCTLLLFINRYTTFEMP